MLRRITYELSEKATNKPCEKDLCFRHTEVDRIFFEILQAILYFLFKTKMIVLDREWTRTARDLKDKS